MGSWLPEPLVEEDAARDVETDETVSLAFLVALERLTPDERAVLVLREAFDYGFDEIADVVGKGAANCRQILSRARRRVAERPPALRPRPGRGPRPRPALPRRGAQGRHGRARRDARPGRRARRRRRRQGPLDREPMVGGAQVGRALATFYRMGVDWGVTLEPVLVNGRPGFRSLAADGRLVNVVGLDVEDGVIRACTRCSTPTSSATSARCRISGCARRSSRRPDANGPRAGLHDTQPVADPGGGERLDEAVEGRGEVLPAVMVDGHDDRRRGSARPRASRGCRA